MIENYADLNQDETLEAVSDLVGERLAEFLEYERDHKNRKTVVEPLERELVDVLPASSAGYGGRYVAGIWFDEVDEPTTVRRSTRIEQAIEAGELQQVDE